MHTDICGPINPVTPMNKKYFLTIIDDHSRYCYVYLIKNKSDAPSCIKDFVEMTKTTFGKKPKIIRSDRGREYINNDLISYMNKEGIRAQYTAPHSPQQNSVAERKNRTLVEMTRCMLIDSGLDKKYWGEALHNANYLLNRLPSTAIPSTAYELWFAKKPDVTDTQIFGSIAHVHIPKVERKKLDNKAEKLIFVGYSEESKAYRLLNPATSKIKISRDVIFENYVTSSYQENKSEIILKENNENEIFIDYNPRVNNNYNQSIDLSNSFHSINDDSSINESDSSHSEGSLNLNDNEIHVNIQENQAPELELRRSQRSNIGVPPDYYVGQIHMATHEDPKTRKEALESNTKEAWISAMQEEISSLEKNKTWTLVDRPKGKNIVSCKWVFKTKKDLSGNISKYKARLVARGFSQKYGVDYDEIFAPVVRHATFRTFLTVAGMKNMLTMHYDAKTAFLNGSLKEDIYMEQPEGFAFDKNKVCKLSKSLYGLKQAAKSWYDTLNQVLKKYNFIQSKTDPCLYSKIVDNKIIYLIVYVDDFLISCTDKNLITDTANDLSKYFDLSDLGELHHYLGIQIKRDEKGIYNINQSQYIDSLTKRFGLTDAKISTVPMDPGYLKIDRKDMKVLPDGKKYQQLIGALLYIAVHTRPDINAAVTILSQHNTNPSQTDWNEVKRILQYLKGTKNLFLKLGNEDEKIKNLFGYADADWAQNKKDRKSNSGRIFKFFGSPISWSCKKQDCVALSSTEAEYVALADAAQEGVWLRRLLADFNMQQNEPTLIFEDNQSCLKLINSDKFSHRTKHIDTKYKFVKYLKHEENIMDYKYCPTEFMLADLFTKPLNKVKLEKMRTNCNIVNM